MNPSTIAHSAADDFMARINGRQFATLLADPRLWGEDLTRIADLAELSTRALARIQAVGVKAAMSELSFA